MNSVAKNKYNVEAALLFIDIEAENENQAIEKVKILLNDFHFKAHEFNFAANEV